jgi:hypothetical protein
MMGGRKIREWKWVDGLWKIEFSHFLIVIIFLPFSIFFIQFIKFVIKNAETIEGPKSDWSIPRESKKCYCKKVK